MKSMLKNLKLVEETYQTEDLIDFSRNVAELKNLVDNSSQISLFGIVGAYGTGKSVMLEAYKKKVLSLNSSAWVHIDAWKYPDRSDLWEGFVLDFARQMKPRQFQKVLSQMDGTSKAGLTTLVKSLGAFTNLYLPGSSSAIDKLTHFTRSSAAKRVFQIQDIFKQLLKGVNKDIYIVVEDADRSGTAGMFFIETLNQFLKNLEVGNKITVLIPIADTSYKDNRHSYIKALDYVYFFDFGSRSLEKLAERVFAKTLIDDPIKKDHLLETVQRLIGVHSLTIRTVKLILRGSELRYKSLQKQGYSPDPRVVLIIESMRHIEEASGGNLATYKDTRQNSRVVRGSQQERLLFAIAINKKLNETLEITRGAGADAVFTREITFVDHTQQSPRGADTSIPYLFDGSYRLPLYYIDN